MLSFVMLRARPPKEAASKVIRLSYSKVRMTERRLTSGAVISRMMRVSTAFLDMGESSLAMAVVGGMSRWKRARSSASLRKMAAATESGEDSSVSRMVCKLDAFASPRGLRPKKRSKMMAVT